MVEPKYYTINGIWDLKPFQGKTLSTLFSSDFGAANPSAKPAERNPYKHDLHPTIPKNNMEPQKGIDDPEINSRQHGVPYEVGGQVRGGWKLSSPSALFANCLNLGDLQRISENGSTLKDPGDICEARNSMVLSIRDYVGSMFRHAQSALHNKNCLGLRCVYWGHSTRNKSNEVWRHWNGYGSHIVKFDR